MTEEQWQQAKARFDETKRVYEEMEGTPGVNTSLALLAVFAPLERRYEGGERTPDLYDSMMSVE